MSNKITRTVTFEEGRGYEITDVFPIDDAPYLIFEHQSTDDTRHGTVTRANVSVRYMTKAIDFLTYIRDEILIHTYTAIDVADDPDLLELEFMQGRLYADWKCIFNIQVRDIDMIPKLATYFKEYNKKYNQSGSKLANLDKPAALFASLEKYNKEKNDYISNILKLCNVCEANDAQDKENSDSADLEHLMREFINGDKINTFCSKHATSAAAAASTE